MIRVGPNQDINDPTDMFWVEFAFQTQSDNVGNMVAKSNSQDQNAGGPPVVDISIPFSMEDGSTEFIFGADLSEPVSGIFDYDRDLVSRANIITYINLPERFRGYWDTIKGAIGGLTDFFTLETQDEPGFGDPDDTDLEEFGSLGTVESIYFENVFIGTTQVAPIWSGFGPTDYNSFTFTQLRQSASRLSVALIPLLQVEWDTNYYYTRQGPSLGFGFNTPLNSRFVQFHNHLSSNIAISLSVNMTATHAASGFVLQYDSWAEIDNLNSFPIVGDLKTLGSFIRITNSSSSTVKALSHTRNIIIPPGKSAFIRSSASDTEVGSPGTYDATITLNGRSVSYSHIFT